MVLGLENQYDMSYSLIRNISILLSVMKCLLLCTHLEVSLALLSTHKMI